MNIYNSFNIKEKLKFIEKNRGKEPLLLEIMISEENFFILDVIFDNYLNFNSNIIPPFDQNNLFQLTKIIKLYAQRKFNPPNMNLNPVIVQRNLLNLFSPKIITECELKLKKNPKILFNFLVGNKISDRLYFFELKYYYKQLFKGLDVTPFLFKGGNLNSQKKCINIFLCHCNGKPLFEKECNSIISGNCTILLFLLESLHEDYLYTYNDINNISIILNGNSFQTNDLNKPSYIILNQILISLDVCFKNIDTVIRIAPLVEKTPRLEKPLLKIRSLISQLIKLDCIKNNNYLILAFYNYWVFNFLDFNLLPEKMTEFFIHTINNLIKNVYFQDICTNLVYYSVNSNKLIPKSQETFNGKIFEFFKFLCLKNHTVGISENITHCLQKNNVNGCFLYTRILIKCLEYDVFVSDVSNCVTGLFEYWLKKERYIKWCYLLMTTYFIKNTNIKQLLSFYKNVMETSSSEKILSDLIIHNIFTNLKNFQYFKQIINFIFENKVSNSFDVVVIIALLNPNGWNYFGNIGNLSKHVKPVNYTCFFKFMAFKYSNPPPILRKIVLNNRTPNYTQKMNFNLERHYSNIIFKKKK